MKFKPIITNFVLIAITFVVFDYGILITRCFQYDPLINKNNGKYCLNCFCIKNTQYIIPFTSFQDSFNYEMLDKKRNITEFYNKQTKNPLGGGNFTVWRIFYVWRFP